MPKVIINDVDICKRTSCPVPKQSTTASKKSTRIPTITKRDLS